MKLHSILIFFVFILGTTAIAASAAEKPIESLLASKEVKIFTKQNHGEGELFLILYADQFDRSDVTQVKSSSLSRQRVGVLGIELAIALSLIYDGVSQHRSLVKDKRSFQASRNSTRSSIGPRPSRVVYSFKAFDKKGAPLTDVNLTASQADFDYPELPEEAIRFEEHAYSEDGYSIGYRHRGIERETFTLSKADRKRKAFRSFAASTLLLGHFFGDLLLRKNFGHTRLYKILFFAGGHRQTKLEAKEIAQNLSDQFDAQKGKNSLLIYPTLPLHADEVEKQLLIKHGFEEVSLDELKISRQQQIF